MPGEKRVTIELEGTLKAVTFKPKGKTQDVVAMITIECYPNQGQSRNLPQLAGKSVEVEISSRQLGLPMLEVTLPVEERP